MDGYASRVVVGHADWSVKHFRFRGGEIWVVYDWDSLRLDRETMILGTAAATFPGTWNLHVPSRAPSPEEMRAFVEEYEAARDEPFSGQERVGDLCSGGLRDGLLRPLRARSGHSRRGSCRQFPRSAATSRQGVYRGLKTHWLLLYEVLQHRPQLVLALVAIDELVEVNLPLFFAPVGQISVSCLRQPGYGFGVVF